MKRGLGLVRQALPMAGLALALAGTGCQDDVNYGYFAVKLTVADNATPDYLGKIAACGVNVEGADSDMRNLSCRVGTRELGTFEWSTTSTGTVRFVINVTDMLDRTIGTGKSNDVAIVPGSTVNVDVLVTPDPNANK